MSDDLNERVVLAAINAAGPMTNPGAWRGKINDLVPAIAGMVREGSPLTKLAGEVLHSQVFTAELVGWDLEETSKRIVVHLRSETTNKSDSNADGTESLRTERTDGGRGRVQLKRLEEAGVGSKLLVYKAMEQTHDGRSVRILAHFEVLHSPQRSDGTTRTPHPGPSSSATAAAPPAPSTGGAAPSHDERERDPLAARFNALPNPVMIRVARRLRAEGIEFPVPSLDHADRFIQIISEEESNG